MRNLLFTIQFEEDTLIIEFSANMENLFFATKFEDETSDLTAKLLIFGGK